MTSSVTIDRLPAATTLAGTEPVAIVQGGTTVQTTTQAIAGLAGGGGGSGNVTSVAMTGDGVIYNATVAGSPITTNGTLIPQLLTQTANTVLAGPTSGGAHTPTFRALVSADIPSIGVAQGGTGLATITAHAVMLGEGTSAVGVATIGVSGRLLIDQGAGADPAFKAMSGDVSITNLGVTSIASIQGTTVSGTTGTGNAVFSIAPIFTGTTSLTATGTIVAQGNITLSGAVTTGSWQGVPVTAQYGGTGLATLTAHAVLLGEGTGNVAFATIGTSGRLLIDQGASADPSFNAMSGDATITNTGSITVTSTNGIAFTSLIASKQPVLVATTGALTATYSNGSSGVGATLTNSGTQAALSIDGVALSVGNRVLVYQQSTTYQNGIYSVTTVGSNSSNWVLTRTTDFNGSSGGGVFQGVTVAVATGTANGGAIFIENGAGPFTIGTTPITFVLNQATIQNISSHYVMSNITGSTAAPIGNTLTSTIDAAIGNTANSILARGSSVWGLATTTTNGQGIYQISGALAAAFSAGQWIDVRDYGAIPNCRRVTDLTATNGSPNIGSAASANFTSADVGRIVTVYDFTNGNYVARTTIKTVSSTTAAVMNANASNNLTSANGVCYIGNDYASNINNAAIAAGNLLDTTSINANQSLGGGRIVLYFPTDSRGSRYLFNSATLSIPTNVIVHADAMLISAVGLGDNNTDGLANRTWALTMSPGACITHLEMDCCYGMGIILGTNSAQSHSFINDLTLWSVGGNYNGALSPTSQTGLGLQGNDFYIGRYWVKGANVGISTFIGGTGCNDMEFTQLFLIGCATGLIVNGSEECFICEAHIDTGSFVGVAIDASHNVRMNVDAFQINATTLTSALDVGQNSSTASHNLNINLSAERVGTDACRLGNAVDSWFNINATNSSNFSGGGTIITNGINFVTTEGALSGQIRIDANIDPTITNTYAGTPYGEIRLNGSTSSVGLAPKAKGINLVMNSDCRIDQPNEGASVSLSSGTAANSIDGWGAKYSSSATGVTIQQEAAGPAGFKNALILTVGTGHSVGASDYLYIEVPIEGIDTEFLGFGASGASPISVQFQAKSSIGTYTAAFALHNSANNRAYVTPFTIASSATWTLITIPNIPGDITGTWVTTEAGVGLKAYIVLACGSTNQTSTLNAWQATGSLASSAITNSIQTTNGATFEITGLQIEPGTVCTPYTARLRGDEYIRCQRYYFKTFPPGTAPAQNAGVQDSWSIYTNATSTFGGTLPYPVPMCQTATTLTTYNPSAASANWQDSTNTTARTVTVGTKGIRGVILSGAAGVVSALNQIHVTADARLTL
jgi:hypothetical protein